MPRYIIADIGAGYEFVWEQEGIAIRIDRIRENSRYEIHGWVNVRPLGMQEGHIHRAQLNLGSTQTKRSLVTACARMAPGIAEPLWEEMVEIALTKAVDLFRSGEAVVQLDGTGVRESLPYRVRPFLFENQPTLLSGTGGGGKSIFALFLALIVHGGLLVPEGFGNGSRMHLEAEPGPVFYLDYETNREIAERRLRLLERGLGIQAPVALYYRRQSQPLLADLEALQRYVKDFKIALVIVDSCGMAGGGEPESAQLVIDYYKALRILGTTSLSIHHLNKAGGVHGSHYWQDYSRSSWELQSESDETSGLLRVGLFHRKVNEGIRQKPFGLTFAFGASSIQVAASDPLQDHTLAESAPLPQRLEHALRTANRLLTLAELVEAVGRNPENQKEKDVVYSTLHRGRDGRPFVQVKGSWGLASSRES